jgi:hypothetical protein
MTKSNLLKLLAALAAPAALLGADITVNSNITSTRTWSKGVCRGRRNSERR